MLQTTVCELMPPGSEAMTALGVIDIAYGTTLRGSYGFIYYFLSQNLSSAEVAP